MSKLSDIIVVKDGKVYGCSSKEIASENAGFLFKIPEAKEEGMPGWDEPVPEDKAQSEDPTFSDIYKDLKGVVLVKNGQAKCLTKKIKEETQTTETITKCAKLELKNSNKFTYFNTAYNGSKYVEFGFECVFKIFDTNKRSKLLFLDNRDWGDNLQKDKEDAPNTYPLDYSNKVYLDVRRNRYVTIVYYNETDKKIHVYLNNGVSTSKNYSSDIAIPVNIQANQKYHLVISWPNYNSKSNLMVNGKTQSGGNFFKYILEPLQGDLSGYSLSTEYDSSLYKDWNNLNKAPIISGQAYYTSTTGTGFKRYIGSKTSNAIMGYYNNADSYFGAGHDGIIYFGTPKEIIDKEDSTYGSVEMYGKTILKTMSSVGEQYCMVYNSDDSSIIEYLNNSRVSNFNFSEKSEIIPGSIRTTYKWVDSIDLSQIDKPKSKTKRKGK